MKKSITLLATFCLVAIALFGQNKPENKDLTGRVLHRSSINQEKQKPGDRTRHHSVTDFTQKSDRTIKLKSGNVIRQKIDYQIWEEYNAESGAWVGIYKDEYAFDNQGNITQQIAYSWDAAVGEWLLNSKDTDTYDANGNWMSGFGYSWNPDTGQWDPTNKYEATYDQNGNQSLSTSYNWDEEAQIWIPNSKSEYTSDAAGNTTQRIDYDWDLVAGTWIPDFKNEVTYDANGIETQLVAYYWLPESGQWLPSSKYVYTYDSNGDLILETAHEWDTVTQAWISGWKYEYGYNSNRQMILYTYSNWDAATGTWQADYKEECQFDSFGNEILDLSSVWNYETNQWGNDYKVDYTFDYDYLFEEVLAPYWLKYYGYFNNKILSSTFSAWDEDLSQWVPDDRDVYFYSDIDNSGITGNSLTPVRVFPNPTNDLIIIELPTFLKSARLELFDIQGREVLATQLSSTRSHIPVGMLQSGMYYYNIRQNKSFFYGKIVVK